MGWVSIGFGMGCNGLMWVAVVFVGYGGVGIWGPVGRGGFRLGGSGRVLGKSVVRL